MALKSWIFGSHPVAVTRSSFCTSQEYSKAEVRICFYRNSNTRRITWKRRFLPKVGIGGENISSIAQNKVVIAAALAASIGQLSKPFSRNLIYGRDFDLRTVLQSGGFPSSHSSAVAATATYLALERGFSDSVFGLSFVYASLVMYDSQGVRKEVGRHATVLNRILKDSRITSNQSINPNEFSAHLVEQSSSVNASETALSEGDGIDSRSPMKAIQLVSSSSPATDEDGQKESSSSRELKESVGHTGVEVIAGALLGVLVGTIAHSIL